MFKNLRDEIKAIKQKDPAARSTLEIFLCYPGFKEFMAKHNYHLNDKERKTCLFTRCDFKPKVISHMLNVDPSYISHLRSDLLQKLFNTYGNSKTFDKMIKDIYWKPYLISLIFVN